MLTFYFAPGSSSMAVHIALHEVGAPFDPKPVSFQRGETRTPAFLAINPAGKVPILVIDGQPLTEVAAILFYLARSYPDAGLLPEGIEAQAQAISWMSFAASTLHAARRQGAEKAAAIWEVAERRLGGRNWALDSYSIADIHLFRLYWRFRPLIGPACDRFVNLAAHQERMLARPAVQRTLAAEQAIGYELPA